MHGNDDGDDDDNSEDSACRDARLKNMVHVSLEDDCNAREEGEYLLRRQRLRHHTVVVSVVSEGGGIVHSGSSGGGSNRNQLCPATRISPRPKRRQEH